MNRDDLLKKCVDRGVADEGSVEAVSHLFYMYLLTALQKGQRVEVPDFGTFGTRVVGVKRLRRMPFFEVEKDLAERVNERYRDLKYLVVGRYELHPAEGDQEYRGKEAPHDAVVDQVGKEMVIDTHRDVTIEEYERTLALTQGTTEAKEKQAMPKLNLKEAGLEGEPLEEEAAAGAPPSAPEPRAQRRGPSALVQALIALALIAAISFALNHFDVIHLWGKRPVKTAETTLPPPEPQQPVTAVPQPTEPAVTPPGTETPTPTPTPVPGTGVAPAQPPSRPVAKPPVEPPATKPPAPAVRPSVAPSAGTGEFTVQVSSWQTMGKANEEAARLTGAGLDAFVVKAAVAGETRYRVRVGRYATRTEAAAAAAKLSEMLENGFWVAKDGSN